MTFPNLPGQRNYQTRANLERALQEIAYYRAKIALSGKSDSNLQDLADALQTEIPNATPETAGELFTDAWHLCRDIERIITK